MSTLAIVIPAYKATFFAKALESLASQTNKEFTVYIGDDNSPENLKDIINKFSNRIDIIYHKFSNNIGSKDIVSQWKRCVNLTKDEPWLWLFSDDDLVDMNAVNNFYKALQRNGSRFDIYRFNTFVIDKNDEITNRTPVGPEQESSEEMAYHLLLGQRGNSMPDHIFSRKVYESNNGFVTTAYAQAADWATSILFSKEKGICIIPDSILYWRLSGINISSEANSKSKQMFFGHLQFILWVTEHFKYLQTKESSISYQSMRSAALTNLRSVIIHHYTKLDNANMIVLFKALTRDLKMPYNYALRYVYDIKRNTQSRINRIINFIKKVIRKFTNQKNVQ